MVEKTADREFRLLREIKLSYEGKGYEFFIDPNPSILPDAFQGFRPDAIAIRADDKVVIEVKLKESPNSQKQLELMAEVVRNETGWRLEIIYLSDHERDKNIKLESPESLRNILADIEDLYENEFYEMVLIHSFAAIEAIGRVLLIKSIKDFQKAAVGLELITTLEQEGCLSFRQSKFLRKKWSDRSKYAHGYFSDVKFGKLEAEKMKTIVTVLFNEALITRLKNGND